MFGGVHNRPMTIVPICVYADTSSGKSASAKMF